VLNAELDFNGTIDKKFNSALISNEQQNIALSMGIGLTSSLIPVPT